MNTTNAGFESSTNEQYKITATRLRSDDPNLNELWLIVSRSRIKSLEQIILILEFGSVTHLHELEIRVDFGCDNSIGLLSDFVVRILRHNLPCLRKFELWDCSTSNPNWDNKSIAQALSLNTTIHQLVLGHSLFKEEIDAFGKVLHSNRIAIDHLTITNLLDDVDCAIITDGLIHNKHIRTLNLNPHWGNENGATIGILGRGISDALQSRIFNLEETELMLWG